LHTDLRVLKQTGACVMFFFVVSIKTQVKKFFQHRSISNLLLTCHHKKVQPQVVESVKGFTAFLLPSQFALWSELANRSLANSLPVTFVPRSELARELSLPGTFALKEYSLPETFALSNFRSLLVRDIICDILLYSNDIYL